MNRTTWILTDAAQTTQFPSFRDGCINKQEEGSRPFGKEFVESSRPQLAPSLGEVFDYIRNDGVLPGVGERVERNLRDFVLMETRSNRIRGNIIVDSFNKILILHRF